MVVQGSQDAAIVSGSLCEELIPKGKHRLIIRCSFPCLRAKRRVTSIEPAGPGFGTERFDIDTLY